MTYCSSPGSSFRNSSTAAVMIAVLPGLRKFGGALAQSSSISATFFRNTTRSLGRIIAQRDFNTANRIAASGDPGMATPPQWRTAPKPATAKEVFCHFPQPRVNDQSECKGRHIAAATMGATP